MADLNNPASPGWRYETGCVVDAENQIIATVCGDDVKRGELLAAAPELLDELRSALTWMESFRRYNKIPDGGPLEYAINRAESLVHRVYFAGEVTQ